MYRLLFHGIQNRIPSQRTPKLLLDLAVTGITQYKMCFTKEVTVGMMAMNLSMALFLQLRGQSFRRYQIFYVFFLMEVLQYCQYLTLDDCGHWLNRLTTVLAYVHVCFQPVSVNYYAFGWEPNGDVVKTVVRIGLIGGSLMVVRLPYLGISQFLSEKLSWMGNEFPDNSMAGTPDTCARTAMCGPQLCARTGNAHLRWEVPLLPATYFIPGDFMHFFLFFIPILIVPGHYNMDRIVMLVVSFVTGPILAMGWTYSAAGDMYRLEWPAIWCAYSGVQCLLAIIWEFCWGLSDARVPGSAENLKWIEKLDKGMLFDSRKHIIPASQQKGNAVTYDVVADAPRQQRVRDQASKKAA